MAERLNVAQRLADGAPAVEHTQSYVWACHVLGYHHPDLTAYASQVRDWYDTEKGLNLGLLDEDCATLRAAADAADEALSRQRAQQAELADAWSGPGAGAATEFLQRHCRAGETVAANIRAAAERCAALRDELWQLIDAKAATAIAVDDRRLAERPAWLAAAQAVLTGAGNASSADDLVDQQIKPYVDADIRTEWLDAMRSTAASVDASLDAATDAVNAAPAPRFDVPGDFAAPSAPLGGPSAPNVDEVPVRVFPAGTGAAPAEPPPAEPPPAGAYSRAPAAPPPAPDDGPAPLPDPLGTALGDVGGLGAASGGGVGGLGSSIGGIISEIVGAIGGLLGSLGDGPDDSSLTDDGLDANDAPDADDPDDQLDPALLTDGEISEPDDGEPSASETPEPAPGSPLADPPPADAPQPDDAPPATDAAPAPVAEPEPPPAEAPSSTEPAPDDRSPCEIAADELPQAGQ